MTVDSVISRPTGYVLSEIQTRTMKNDEVYGIRFDLRRHTCRPTGIIPGRLFKKGVIEQNKEFMKNIYFIMT